MMFGCPVGVVPAIECPFAEEQGSDDRQEQDRQRDDHHHDQLGDAANDGAPAGATQVLDQDEEQTANRKGQAVHESCEVGRHAKARADHAAQRPTDQQGYQPADAKRKTQSRQGCRQMESRVVVRFDLRCVVFGHRYQVSAMVWNGSFLVATWLLARQPIASLGFC